MEHRTISVDDATSLIERDESHFWDHKSARSSGATIQKIGAALANADGGEFIVGVEDKSAGSGLTRWIGFDSIEAATPVLEALARDTKPPVPYSVEFLSVEEMTESGIAVLVEVRKSENVHLTADGKVYVRRAAASTVISGQAVIDLTLSKGARSYEDQLLADYDSDDLSEEDELAHFLATYSPSTDARDFIRKQRLVNRNTGKAKISSAILYAENPSAVVPKRCSIKISRYNTKDAKPRRDHLVSNPTTIEGPARLIIEEAIRQVTEMIEAVSILRPDGTMAPMSYPPEALKELIVNAVIHRDYNISDDIRISVLNNRVEVRSPGSLPGHMTLANLTEERFARNPNIVRLLNKYPEPPNKDIGEGLRTVLDKMTEAKLQAPKFYLDGNYFVVELGHTPLARPEEIVLEYLDSHTEITNLIGRGLTGITSENAMKEVFYTLRNAGKLEKVPGKAGNKSAWRLVQTMTSEPSAANSSQVVTIEQDETAEPSDIIDPRHVGTAMQGESIPAKHKALRKFTFRPGRAPARNHPCPCGSGVKFKLCHGRPGQDI
jgi:ATP-dependent DNA helicase RecG